MFEIGAVNFVTLMWNKPVQLGDRTEIGCWSSLLDVPIPDTFLWGIVLTHYNDSSNEGCRCYLSCTYQMDDLAGIEYPRNRCELIETNGGFRSAIEKGSQFGTVIEVGRCGTNLYNVIYQ